MQTKGIAIRINEELYNKIEKQKIPRNDLVADALYQYFHSDELSVISEDSVSSNPFDEAYSILYNTEISPLKNKIKHQEEVK